MTTFYLPFLIVIELSLETKIIMEIIRLSGTAFIGISKDYSHFEVLN